jgi:hypothetical protein
MRKYKIVSTEFTDSEDVMVLRCPVGVSASSITTEVHVCSADSVGIGRAAVERCYGESSVIC